MRAPILVTVILAASACSLDPWNPTVGGRPDAGPRDSGTFDAAISDAGPFDAGSRDAGLVDSGGFDAGPGDDAGPRDGGCPTMGPDRCDRIDNDCDPSTVDGSGEPTIGMPCDGPDSDLCEEGVIACTMGMLACDDTSDDSTETCNAIDDDCDGMIDIGAGCPCEVRLRGTEPYLFCGMLRWWDQAQRLCAGLGYNLATIDDRAESDWVTMNTFMVRTDRDWWIGLNDLAVPDTFVWESGSTSVYRNWGSAEPNNFGGTQACVQIDDGNAPWETRGFWSDNDCNENRPFVCSLP